MTEKGAGYAVSSLERLGEGYGFRKIRQGLGVTAFGINAIVLPPYYETGVHYHEQPQETYFVDRGRIEITTVQMATQLPDGALTLIEVAIGELQRPRAGRGFAFHSVSRPYAAFSATAGAAVGQSPDAG